MPWNKENYSTQMDKTLNVFNKELAGVRTGRANPGLLDSVFVEVYGQKMKLSQIASVNVVENATLGVNPFDKSHCSAIEKAINEANLGVSVNSASSTLLIKLPKMTEDTRKEWIKYIKKSAENSKVAIRNIRRDGMEDVKKLLKDKLLSEDEKNKNETTLQKITDDAIAKIDSMVAAKEKEILEI